MKHKFFWVAVAVCGYEVYALLNREPDDTISEMTWCANRRPIVPFLAGMIAGHLFWQRDASEVKSDISLKGKGPANGLTVGRQHSRRDCADCVGDGFHHRHAGSTADQAE